MDLGNQQVRSTPHRFRSLAGPAGAAAGAVVAAAILHVRDPHVEGAYGFCPMYALTGMWCPACGGLRAVHDLTNFDVGAAVGSNALLVPFLLVAVLAWTRWVVLRWRGSSERVLVIGRSSTIVVSVVLLAFTVTRNTPWGSWLAPA
ncbi:DUF2752 domain-containing protein [Rhodococcus sp. NPDC058521]|uniref:DUF2752 domain-containing protein n=1 Tax=Rhodococcus sp. NPDC058521 TaxID=3346536 RepID=UPI00364F1ADD